MDKKKQQRPLLCLMWWNGRRTYQMCQKLPGAAVDEIQEVLVVVWVVIWVDIWSQEIGEELGAMLRYRVNLVKDKAVLQVRGKVWLRFQVQTQTCLKIGDGNCFKVKTGFEIMVEIGDCGLSHSLMSSWSDLSMPSHWLAPCLPSKRPGWIDISISLTTTSI